MVDRVVMHIGLPKTGTTYLQDILWGHRSELAAAGVVLPGFGHREHLWAALGVQENPNLARRHEDAPGAWDRLCAELAAAPGTGLFTHEFFCGASADQARRAVEQLAPAEVSVVVTARDAASQLTAGWQEMVKNGSTLDLYAAASETRRGEFSWQTWDLHGVLSRWLEAVPAERIHVLPIPGPGAAPDQHWRNFASVLGIDLDLQAPAEAMNRSLGVVQVELLRRVNAHLGDFSSAFDRGQWIRGYLAEGQLSDQEGDRFGLTADLLEDCRQRSARARDLIAERGVAVVGDPGSLDVPGDFGQHRSLADVSESELVESAGHLIADLLADVRDLTRERDDAEDETPPAQRSWLSGALSRIRPT